MTSLARTLLPAVVTLCCVTLFVYDSPVPVAEFELNFTANGNGGGRDGGSWGGWGGGGDGAGGWSNVECSGGGGSSGGDSGGGGWGGGGSGFFSLGRGCGSGYFLQEVGNGYFHVIVGDPSEDFVLEWYIRSSGEYGTALSTGYLDNIDNPLGPNVSQTGNGAGNPRAVHMRAVIRDAGIEQEFIKPLNTRKPKISQQISDAGMTSTFSVDMTHLDYNTADGSATVVNRVTITDPTIPEGSANFDMEDAPGVQITAGKYTHPGGEFKNYTYAEDGFDVYRTRWIDYCDPLQNTDHHCDIGGTGGGGGWGSGGGGWSFGGGW